MPRALTLVVTLLLSGSLAHADESLFRQTLNGPELDLARCELPAAVDDDRGPSRTASDSPSFGRTPTLTEPSRAGAWTHTSLIVSLASLQGLDIALTLRGISRGGIEANPLMSGVVESPAAFVALKAGTTAVAIYGIQKMRKQYPRAATVLALAMNATMAAVVAHNAGVK